MKIFIFFAIIAENFKKYILFFLHYFYKNMRMAKNACYNIVMEIVLQYFILKSALNVRREYERRSTIKKMVL